MTTAPSIRGFRRKHPDAIAGRVAHLPFFAMGTLFLGLVWLGVVFGFAIAGRAGGLRAVSELFAIYLLELLPLVGVTGLGLWAMWDALVIRGMLGRANWAISSDALLIVAENGERGIIPLADIEEVHAGQCGWFPGLQLRADAPDAERFRALYKAAKERWERNINSTDAMESALLARLGARDPAAWTKTPGEWVGISKTPDVYRRAR